MRIAVVASALIVLAGPMAPVAHATDTGCEAVLGSVTEKWQAAEFSTPAKPSQLYVAGRDGRQASAAEVAYMRGQINRAAQDCRNGQSARALERLSAVEQRLDTATGTQLAGRPAH